MEISARLGNMYSSNKISEHPYLKNYCGCNWTYCSPVKRAPRSQSFPLLYTSSEGYS